MIDLRLRSQYYKGFYIFKEPKGYGVGKNGTSIHTFIKKSKNVKQHIINYINQGVENASYN